MIRLVWRNPEKCSVREVRFAVVRRMFHRRLGMLIRQAIIPASVTLSGLAAALFGDVSKGHQLL